MSNATLVRYDLVRMKGFNRQYCFMGFTESGHYILRDDGKDFIHRGHREIVSSQLLQRL